MITFPLQLTGRSRQVQYVSNFTFVIPGNNPVPDSNGYIPKVGYNSLTNPYHSYELVYTSVTGVIVTVSGPSYIELGLDSSGQETYSGPWVNIEVGLINSTYEGPGSVGLWGTQVLESAYENTGTITGTLNVSQLIGLEGDPTLQRLNQTILTAAETPTDIVTDPPILKDYPGIYGVLPFTINFNGSYSGNSYVSSSVNSFPWYDGSDISGYVQNGTAGFIGTTTIDGQTFSYPWSYSTQVTAYNPLTETFGNVTGDISASYTSGLNILLSDYYQVTNIDYGFYPPLYDFSSCQYGVQITNQQTPREIKGQFYCFKDPYPQNQGIVYSGPGNPEGTYYHKSGTGLIDVKFTQQFVELGGGDPIFEGSDYVNVTADSAIFNANGDTTYELPLGRAFFWPAFTLSHQQSTTWTPDSWTAQGAASIGTGDGLCTFTVKNATDSVTGVFNKLHYHQAWRYCNYSISGVPDVAGSDLGNVTITINNKSWVIPVQTDNTGSAQIDTCEPYGASDKQDGQDSFWPLVPYSYNGTNYWIPQQERLHWGTNYVTQIKFSGLLPNVQYTITQIQPHSNYGMEIECSLAQGGVPATYTTETANGVTTHLYARRGFRVQIDGRLALEMPWQIFYGSQSDQPGSVPIISSPGTVNTLLNLQDYINSIDGFTFTLSNDRNQFFNKNAPLNGWIDDLFAGGIAFDGTTWHDGTTISVAPQTAATIYYGCKYDDFDSLPAQGDPSTGNHYGDGNQPITFNFAGHFRDRAWSVAWENGKPLSGANIVATNTVSGANGGNGTTRDDGWFETGLPYLINGQTYNLSTINAKVTSVGRRSDKPQFKTSTSLAHDVAQNGRHVLSYNASTVMLNISSNAYDKQYTTVDTGIQAYSQTIRWTKDNQQRLKLMWSDGSNVMYQYSLDEGHNWTMPITLGSGNIPAFVVSSSGTHYHYWLSPTSPTATTSNIMGQIRSNTDNVIVQTFTVLSGVDQYGLAVDEHYGAGGAQYIKLAYSIGGTMYTMSSQNGVNFS